MIYRLPKILGVGRWECVTYSELIDLQKCLLRGSASRLLLSAPLPAPMPTRATIVGTFHHRAMEAAGYGLGPEQLEEKLEEMIVTAQKEASASRHLRRLGPVSNWDEINRSFTSAVRWSRMRREGKSFDTMRVEQPLTSSDGMLVGKPDRYAIGEDQAVLIEFKTSSLRDAEGDVREEYLTQLNFYAALLIDNYPVKQVVARLESTTGEEFSAAIGQDEATKFAAGVKDLLSDANKRIATLRSAADLASPTTLACNYCRLRVLCSAFVSRQKEMNLQPGQAVLIATLQSRGSHDEGGAVAHLALDEGNRTIQLAAPGDLVSDMQLQRRYAFANLDFAGASFRWTEMTQVFSFD